MRAIIIRVALLTSLILMLVPGSLPGQSGHSRRSTTRTGSVTAPPQTRPPEPPGEDLSAKTVKELWTQVDQAWKKRLPRTAAGLLQEIYRRTSAAGDWPQALKALIERINFNAATDETPETARIRLLTESLGEVPPRVQPVLQIVLAYSYWQYFESNRWQILNRQSTAGINDTDPTTWDLARLFREIDRHYQAALASADRLQAMPVSGWLDFLVKGDLPLDLRPTLFDFVAWEALAFYTTGEQAGAQPEELFEPTAESPILAGVTDFLAWRPTPADAASPVYRALTIYQSLLSFHRHDRNPAAFLDADIHRLRWARSVAAGEEKDERFRRRLDEIATTWPASPLSALARYYRADSLFDAGEWVAALAVARKGIETFPDSRGGLLCRTLAARITAREYDLTTETTVIPNRPSRIKLTYRNLTRLHFRLLRRSFDQILEKNFSPPSDKEWARLRRETPVMTWSAELDPTRDYHSRTVGVDVPALEPGIYLLLAGCRADFADPDNKIQTGWLQVSALAAVVRSLGGRGEGFVVDRASGEPIPGATVTVQTRSPGNRREQDSSPMITDSNGQFSMPDVHGYNRCLMIFTPDGRRLLDTRLPWWGQARKSEQTFHRTVFFTDRAIYRPGQMIRFKGICVAVDQDKTSYRVLKSQSVTVSFRDTNDREITHLDLVTNEYGSFSGTVIAPTDRLTGEMHLVTSDPHGSTSIRVEEYKRPKFDITLQLPDRAWRLGDQIEIPGSAMGFTGAAVDGASVRYRVKREPQLPPWWFWRGGALRSGAREIAHGAVKTNADGTFTIPFTAEPDRKIPASAQPVFMYVVNVDVTDSAGETHSDKIRIRLGYSALEAQLTAPEWQTSATAVPLAVQVSNLQGSPQMVRGTLEIFRLRGPDRPVPADILGIPQSEGNETAINQTADWRGWPTDERILSRTIQTAAKDDSPAVAELSLTAGVYLARYTARDETGQPITAEYPLLVIDPAAEHFSVSVPDYFVMQKNEVLPGEVFTAVWGTGYDQGPVRVDIYTDNRQLQGGWQPAGTTQVTIRVPVTEALRGGFTVVTTFVRENRCYTHKRQVQVPWSDRQLKLQWQSFRSRLEAGRPEHWSLRITGPDSVPRAAELVATLYDASLDQFIKHYFPTFQELFRMDRTSIDSDFDNANRNMWTTHDALNKSLPDVSSTYIQLPFEAHFSHLYGLAAQNMFRLRSGVYANETGPIPPPPSLQLVGKAVVGGIAGGLVNDSSEYYVLTSNPSAEYGQSGGAVIDKTTGSLPDLAGIRARRNLEETAFFLPRLRSDADGTVTIDFTAPEALTRWRFLAFAHTPDLCWGTLEASAVTRKELMVQPNPPRFLREGDELELTVKVTNMADSPARGSARLTLFDPRTDEPLDTALGNTAPDTAIDIPAHRSRPLSWRITVPDGLQVVGYRAVAATSSHSDGEEGVLPVLSRRIPLREALPLQVTGPGSETFSFDALRTGADAPGRRNLSLTVQMASNPAWYAVMSLPYLMEFPYECSEQLFHRLYANALARHLATAQPRLRRIFDQWKGTAALDSPLDKNEALTGVQLRETPWVRDAGDEHRARQMVGALFDATRLHTELTAAYRKLALSQLHDGSWPWFPGGRGDTFITLTVVTGFGRLAHLGIGFGNLENPGPDDVPAAALTRALQYLDTLITDRYRRLHTGDHPDADHLSDIDALYLYGRSFFLRDHPLDARTTEAVAYFRTQAVRYWTTLDSRRSQAHLALALERFGDREPALAIMRSLKERSITSPETGRHWPEPATPWHWAEAPIETQALLIEAFDEVTHDAAAVDECRVWLLRQKQTRHWGTTTATADAVYALLGRGTDWLADRQRVSVRLDGVEAVPDTVEAGTGFWEVQLDPATIIPALADVTVTKTGPGIAWGGVHWQYLEDIARVEAPAGTPLTLSKTLFVRRDTERGPVIEPVAGPLAVGDRVTVRLVLRVDRDMDYVHLKDLRGSGLEPENVLSGYRYRDGLGYYESTRDTAAHFFIDHLPKGTYVFEYPLRVSLRGRYQTGVATVECMYAPVFAAHSASTELTVK